MRYSPSIKNIGENFRYLYHAIFETLEGRIAVTIIIFLIACGVIAYLIMKKFNIKLRLNLFDSMSYKRPYCERCKVIYGKTAINRLLFCQKCGGSLILKNFNPYLKLWAGLGIMLLGCLTVLVKEFPAVWIGGFIGGLFLLANGFENWQSLKKVDGERLKYCTPLYGKIKSLFTFNNHIVIRCSNCGQKLRLPKSKKVLNITCPKCRYSFKSI